MVHENLKILIFETGSLWLFLNFAVKLYLAKTGPETGQEIANQRKDYVTVHLSKNLNLNRKSNQWRTLSPSTRPQSQTRTSSR